MHVPSNMSLRKKPKTDYKAMLKNVYMGGKQAEAAAAAEAAGTIVPLDDKNMEEKKEEKNGRRDDKMTLGLPAEAIPGASYLKYELVMKNGNKALVPVRYSIRNQNLDTTFFTKEAMLDALYEPNEMENMFSMGDTAQ